MTQEEFEDWIDGDFAESRNELRTEQVTPVYDIWRSAYLRVRPDREDQVREVRASLSEWVQGFLQLRTGKEIRRSYASFEEDARFFITESYDTFVDEYRIEGSVLKFISDEEEARERQEQAQA